MNVDKIKELVEMLETSSLHKLQLKSGEEELVLEKESLSQGTSFSAPPPYQGMPIQPTTGAEHKVSPSSSSNEEVDAGGPQLASNYTEVVAPLVGIYYAASSPESDPYVTVGSRVNAGDTICIIEAMKVLNEIKAPVAGEIKAIHVKNGDVLSYDQILMEIGE